MRLPLVQDGTVDLVAAAERALIQRWQRERRAGDPAARELVDFLVAANRSLLARAGRRRPRRLDHGDLHQAAHLGLLTALARFRPDHGVPFGPYASSWIRKERQRTVAAGEHPIAVPPHRLADLAVAQRRLGLDRPPTDAQLAVDLRVGVETAAGLRAVVTTVPIDAAPEPADGADEIGHAELRIVIAGALGRLAPRPARVVELRYGLGDGRPRSLREVAALLGVSDFTVRADLARAHERLSQLLR